MTKYKEQVQEVELIRSKVGLRGMKAIIMSSDSWSDMQKVYAFAVLVKESGARKAISSLKELEAKAQ